MPIFLAGIVQDRTVSMSIHRKRMLETLTNVCNEKRAATFSILFPYQKPNIVLFGGEGHIALKKRRVVTTRLKNRLLL